MIPLQGEHIILRALEPSDLDYLYKWENDPENWFVSNTLIPFSKYVLKKYIEHSGRDIYESKQLRLMIVLKKDKSDKNIPIGTVDLFDLDPYNLRAGIGILVAQKEYRRKGIASEALELMVKYAFNHLRLHQLYCNIATDNQASLKLFQNSGFLITGEKKEWLKGKDGWVGEYILQLIHPEK